MARSDLVVIGGSAGSIEALQRVLARLPPGFQLPILIVVHLPSESHSYLPEILSRAGALPAKHPSSGEAILAGTIYVAPPDNHMTVVDGTIRLTRGPRENRHRPAIDTLFRTAAESRRDRLVGVLLSGALGDGVLGLQMVKEGGGIAIVQDPAEAMISSMPSRAIERVDVDLTLPAEQIGARLAELGRSVTQADESRVPNLTPGDRPMDEERFREEGTPSVFGCPECGGVLWELHDGALTAYRCRIGHTYSDEGLDGSQRNALEDALWAAYRALGESSEFSGRLAQRARQQGMDAAARRFDERARESRQQAVTIGNVLDKGVGGGPWPASLAAAAVRNASGQPAGGESAS